MMVTYLEFHNEYNEDKKDLQLCEHDWQEVMLTPTEKGFKCNWCDLKISLIEYEMLEDYGNI